MSWGLGDVGRIVQIILLDLVLAGDNAVVIAMAAAALPVRQQRTAIVAGAFMAVVLRIGATLLMATLLQIAYLQLIGGIGVLWIAVRLLVGDEEAAMHDKQVRTIWGALWIICMADLIMSLDNMLAVAGAAEGDMGLIVFGLMLSIPIIVFCSSFITGLMNKYNGIAEIGAAILGYTGGHMIAGDDMVHNWGVGLVGESTYTAIDWGLRIGLAIAVILVARIIVRYHQRQEAWRPGEPAEPSADTAAAETPAEQSAAGEREHAAAAVPQSEESVE